MVGFLIEIVAHWKDGLSIRTSSDRTIQVENNTNRPLVFS